jgi:hypothetical protein
VEEVKIDPVDQLQFGQPNAVYFFTGRFEMGNHSVYNKYARSKGVVEAATED